MRRIWEGKAKSFWKQNGIGLVEILERNGMDTFHR